VNFFTKATEDGQTRPKYVTKIFIVFVITMKGVLADSHLCRPKYLFVNTKMFQTEVVVTNCLSSSRYIACRSYISSFSISILESVIIDS
jgi:hypothetical protein